MTRKKSDGRKGKRKRKQGKKRSFLRRYMVDVFLGLAFVSLVGSIWYVVSERFVDQGEEKVEKSVPYEAEQPGQVIEERTFQDKRSSPPPAAARLRPESGDGEVIPMIGLIIDDLGPSLEDADELLTIDAPIAFAILPHCAYSRDIAIAARSKGHVVMLHLPMEPESKKMNPGQGALLVGDDTLKLVELISKNLDSVPGAEGVNNHMGSRFTANADKMEVVIGEIGKRGLFFVDSRTTADTVAFRVAQAVGVSSAKRDVFLDNDRDVGKIGEKLMELAEKARRNGHALGIGHPYPETMEAIRANLEKIRAKGARIVPVTALLQLKGD